MKKKFVLQYYINWPNFITKLCFTPKLFNNMFRVSCLGIWWRHDIWISEKLESDYLKNEKSFWSEIKNTFLVSKVLPFRHTKQTNENVAEWSLRTIFLQNIRVISTSYGFLQKLGQVDQLTVLFYVFIKNKSLENEFLT